MHGPWKGINMITCHMSRLPDGKAWALPHDLADVRVPGCWYHEYCKAHPNSDSTYQWSAIDKRSHLQAVPSLLWWETRRKDFAENMLHHFATLGLIIYSYQVK